MNYTKLNNEEDYLIELQQIVETELEKYSKAKGRLGVRKNHNSFQYYINGKYVKRQDQQSITAIACREYYERLQKLIKIRRASLRQLTNKLQYTDLKRYYAKLNPGRRILLEQVMNPSYKSPLIDDETAARIWSQIDYEHWIIDEEQTSFITNRGERVRSKSEKIIADELDKQGIAYKYECPLKLKVGRRSQIFRPDFLCFNARTRQEIVYEHMGMMDDMEYVDRYMEKIHIYEKSGYIVGYNFFMTQETSAQPLDITILRRKIELFLK